MSKTLFCTATREHTTPRSMSLLEKKEMRKCYSTKKNNDLEVGPTSEAPAYALFALFRGEQHPSKKPVNPSQHARPGFSLGKICK